MPKAQSIPSSIGPVSQHPGPARGGALTLEELSEVLASMPDSMMILGADWTIRFANSQAVHLLHSGPLVGDVLWELFPHTSPEPFQSSCRRAMAERVNVEFEAFYPEPLQTWYRVSVRPHSAGGLILYFSDITSRKAAEERRDEAAGQLEDLFEATANAVVCAGPDWKCTFANPRAGDLLGAECRAGQSLWTHLPLVRREPVAAALHRAMGERVTLRFELHTPELYSKWLFLTVRPFRDGVLLNAADISERKQAELDRDRAAGALGEVLEVTSDSVLTIGKDWKVTFVNRRATEVLQPAGDLLNRDFWECFPSAIYPDSPFVENYRRTMEQRVATTFEAFYPAPLNAWYRVEARPAEEGIVLFFRDVTADRLTIESLRQNAEALRRSEARYRILTDLNPQLIFTSDVHGHINFANQRLLEYIGVPAVNSQPVNWGFAVHPEDRDWVTAAWQRSISSGHEFAAQARILRADDNVFRWVEIAGLPIRDAEGNNESWLVFATDVHDRKTASEALAASEERYRVLADLNPQFIWMGSAEGAINYANQRFLDYIGRHLTPDGSSHWLTAFAPEDRQRVIAAWTHSVQTGEDYSVEARLIRHADGEPRWFHIRALPVRNDAGQIDSWLGVAMDIHDRRNFAETLRAQQIETERQRAELETIYENTPVGLALFDPVEFRFLRINDEQARIIGLPREQILGRCVLDFTAGVASFGELFRQAASGHPVRDRIVEGELQANPGVSRTWNVNYFPVRDDAGNITGITAASLEITQQRKAELALMQSEKLAAVGRLASSISHEINNPLEAITNLLYLVAHSAELPEELKVYVHMAQSELSRVSQIATQTLRFHRQAVGPTEVTAAQLVDAVLNLYQGRLTNSGIRVDARYSSSTAILCFENDIRQVLNNLIANAIDAMRTGGRLLLRAHDAMQPGSGIPGIRITVADTGHGISRATQGRLFEPFFTTKGLNGTGLGLWISSGIVTRHQGRLTLRSSQHPLHHGTVFSLFLPLRETEEPGPGETAPA